MAVRSAVDASVAPDAGRWAAILELHQEEVRDFRWATAEPERLLLPARQNVLELCWVSPQPQDAWQKAAHWTALWGVRLQPVVSRLPFLQARVDESVPLQSLRARKICWPLAPLPEQERGPYVAPEQPRPPVLPAFPPAQH
jgi:hypothetical protein